MRDSENFITKLFEAEYEEIIHTNLQEQCRKASGNTQV
jgi:hypothetical protein